MSQNSSPARRSAARTVTIVVLIAAIIVCAYSAYNIYAILSEDASSDEVTQTMRSFVRTVAPEESAAPPTGETAAVQPEAPGVPASAAVAAQSPLLEIDFSGLQDINSEIIAWIDIPGTDISYPVVQTDNDDYYLTHSYDGTRNRAGAIFLDSRVETGFAGQNTVIYGHRMNNGSMFGTLHRLDDADYRKQHEYIHIYLPGQAEPVVYQIFATWDSSASLDSTAYQVDFADPEAAEAWLSDLAAKSFVEGAPQPGSEILTLSTCVRGDGSTRFIVAAQRLN